LIRAKQPQAFVKPGRKSQRTCGEHDAFTLANPDLHPKNLWNALTPWISGMMVLEHEFLVKLNFPAVFLKEKRNQNYLRLKLKEGSEKIAAAVRVFVGADLIWITFQSFFFPIQKTQGAGNTS